MTANPETPLRADARRNRDLIIAAARTIFTDQGPDAPMEDIAKAAAVGVGTLYRRFPDRDALIREVARDNFSRVLTEAAAAIEEEPTAWDALTRLVSFSRELRLSVRLAMLSPQAEKIIHDDPVTEQYRADLLAVLDRIVREAQREGLLRKDIGTGDVAVLCTLLLRQLPTKLDGLEFAVQRCMTLLLDGLRAEPGTPLPGRPITKEDLFRQRPEGHHCKAL